MTAFKLNVKIGTSEFSAEGAESLVKEQFSLFLSAIASAPPAPAVPPPPAGIGGSAQANGAAAVTQATLERVFAVDENSVSLRLLPRTDRREADALVVLLYGFRVLSNQQDVNSGNLMNASRQSGLQITRLDTTLAAHHGLITEGGFKRGKRYGLNNQGVNHAEQVILGMVQ